MTKLSIIVPVYNVEKYIRPCFESIFKQGLDDNEYEIIIVNDGTKDRSMEMIADIISQHHNITVINQENQGLSVARNNGISVAKGEYILMPDSDDLLIENSVPKLLEAALSTKADLIVADFLEMEDEEIERTKNTPTQQIQFDYHEKTGEQLFLEDLSPYQCYIWRTLFRRDFLIKNKIKFVPGVYYQDVPFTHECYLKAKKCIRSEWHLNIYRKGHESATYSFNKKKAKDFCIVISKTWELTHLEGLSLKAYDKLYHNIYTSFSVMICTTVHYIEKVSDMIEIIDFFRQLVPNLYFKNSIKHRLIYYMFNHFPHSYVHIRHLYAIIIEERIRPFFYHRLRRRYILR